MTDLERVIKEISGVKVKTLGEFFNHDFEKGRFRLYDSEGNITYWEDSDKNWYRSEYDSEGRVTYWEDSDKNWYRYERDSEGREDYYEDSSKFWSRYERDSEGNETYYEDSCGNTRGVSREVVEMTMEEVEKLAGKRVKISNKENN